MLDGIKFTCEIRNFFEWQQRTQIQFYVPTNISTGEIHGKVTHHAGYIKRVITHKTKIRGYTLVVKEVQTIKFVTGFSAVSYFLTVEGSLHKSYYQGENASTFRWGQLIDEIESLESFLAFDGCNLRLRYLEFGLNVRTSFPAFPFLKDHLVGYKGKRFYSYAPDRNKRIIGFFSRLSHYLVKVYDKGLQFNLKEHILRFELRYIKMQRLNKMGITNLSDLKNKHKVYFLYELLLEAWEGILLCGHAKIPLIVDKTSRKNELLTKGRCITYWEELKTKNRRKYYTELNSYKCLLQKEGFKEHSNISKAMVDTWEALF